MPDRGGQIEGHAVELALIDAVVGGAFGEVAGVNADRRHDIADGRQRAARGVDGDAATVQHGDIGRRAGRDRGVELGRAGPIRHDRLDLDIGILGIPHIGERRDDAAFAGRAG